jgi:hypothetical protein
MAEFSPQAIFRTLERHGVRYVLVGGVAAVLHGSPHVTTDVDVVPQDGRENLERLSEALKEIHARIRVAGEPEGVPFDHSAESLSRVRVWNLVTDHGDLDLTFMPSGTRGYDDLSREARPMTIGDVAVPVASLADVIRSKEAAGREKDRLTLPVLRRILEERSGDGGDPPP